MSNTPTDGPAPLTVYDIANDERRPVTQAEIDRMASRLFRLELFLSEARSLLPAIREGVES